MSVFIGYQRTRLHKMVATGPNLVAYGNRDCQTVSALIRLLQNATGFKGDFCKAVAQPVKNISSKNTSSLSSNVSSD